MPHANDFFLLMKEKLIRPGNETACKEMLRQGDATAIAGLFETYYSLLLGYACKFVSRPAAEDIVQDLFVTLLKKQEQIDIRLSIKAYLLRSIRNRCVDHIRHSQVHQQYTNQAMTELTLRELDYFDPSTGNISLLVADHEQAVNQAIVQLPSRCREILHLKYQHNLSAREIGQLLHISSRTVETQLYKAIKAIRQKVQKLSYLLSFLSL